MSRTLSTVVGSMVVLAALATAAPAGASAEDEADRDAPKFRMVPETSSAPPTFAPQRSITSNVVVRKGELVFRGDVQAYVRREVTVQRKACDSCDWRVHEVVRTGDHGWFRSRISAPRRGSTFWRARVPASDGYARAYSATWETHY